MESRGQVFRQVIANPHASLQEVALTLGTEDLARMERIDCPRFGAVTDRRALLHFGWKFMEDNVRARMCYIRGCKHLR